MYEANSCNRICLEDNELSMAALIHPHDIPMCLHENLSLQMESELESITTTSCLYILEAGWAEYYIITSSYKQETWSDDVPCEELITRVWGASLVSSISLLW